MTSVPNAVLTPSGAHEAATAIALEIGDHPQVVWARARGRGAAEIRRRAHVVCQRCGSRLREPGPHYAISTIECPGGEWLTAEEDAEEMQRRAEEARRRLAERHVGQRLAPDVRDAVGGPADLGAVRARADRGPVRSCLSWC